MYISFNTSNHVNVINHIYERLFYHVILESNKFTFSMSSNLSNLFTFATNKTNFRLSSIFCYSFDLDFLS